MLANLTNRQCDRFIPQRSHFKPYCPLSPYGKGVQQQNSVYGDLIKKQLFSSQEVSSIFSSQEGLPALSERLSEKSLSVKEFSSKLQPNVESPVKILDVPNYRDDFYLNNLDWSQKGSLGIALENQVFLYTPDNVCQVKKSSMGGAVTGIKIQDQIMAVGLSNGFIEMYDIEKCCLVRTLSEHQNRVSALMFMQSLLVSGSKDKSVLVHDLREKKSVIKEYLGHKGEICVIKAKNESQKIFASGGADGTAIVWDLKFGFIDQFKGHKGAVKALDWCPWKNGLLATGGGNKSDRSIKIWNTTNSQLLFKQSIQSQVSSLVWNEQINMMITAHGYDQNCLNFWSLDSTIDGNCRLQSRKKFNAHSARILNLSQSYNKHYLCTVGADQNLKFWQLVEGTSSPFANCSRVQNNEDDVLRL